MLDNNCQQITLNLSMSTRLSTSNMTFECIQLPVPYKTDPIQDRSPDN